MSPPAALAGALGFAIVIGAGEESVFFRVLLTPLLRQFPSGGAVVMTALAFGLAHFNGVQNGLVGIVLAET